MRRLRAGVLLLDETEGDGARVERGDVVTIESQMWLNRGDPVGEAVRSAFVVGRRRVIAGVEYAVDGMKVGGRRRVRIGPHLAYGHRGVPGAVPPDAVLVCEIRLIERADPAVGERHGAG